jgi:hypothetical protein
MKPEFFPQAPSLRSRDRCGTKLSPDKPLYCMRHPRGVVRYCAACIALIEGGHYFDPQPRSCICARPLYAGFVGVWRDPTCSPECRYEARLKRRRKKRKASK